MKILIADGHHVVADALGSMFGALASVSYSLPEAYAVLEKQGRIETCLLDLRMPGMNDDRLISQFMALSGRRPVMLMAGSANLSEIKWAEAKGFSAFLPKTLPGPAFLGAVRDVQINRQADAGWFGSFMAPKVQDVDSLSPRELDIINLLKLGITNKEIAAIAEVSPETVKSHLKTLRTKLGANTRTGLVVKAIEQGYIRG